MAEPTNSNVPKIRFKGCVEAWEEKTLGEIYSERNERGNDSLQILSVSIHSGISNGELDDQALGKQVRRSEDKSLYKHVYPGDVVLNMMRAWQGGIGVATVEGMVSPAYITAIPGNSIYPIFMNANLRRSQIVAQMDSLSYGVTYFRKRLYWDSFIRVELHIPSVPEQKKIAVHFSHLDSLIFLQQRKHDKLVTLKKAMLQKMFPQPGTPTPEIRFKGFDGPWVEKKLGEVIDLGSGRDYKHLSHGNIPVYGTGGYMLSVNEALSPSIDAVGIGRKGTIDKPYILRAPFWTVDTLFYAIPRAGNDLDFVYCLFQQIEWKKKDESTGVPSLSKVAVNGVDVPSTTSAEQQKIGHYFRTLDELITHHAVQLAKLKQLKSACLERMFV
jgi:type I restriction enzyme, S subunit